MNENTPEQFFEGFAWAVPVAFADCLNECRFEKGDRLYDSREAYQRWEDALKVIRFSVQVQSTGQNSGGPESHSSKKQTSPDRTSNLFEQGWSSEVVCAVTDFRRKTTEEIRTTQGRLYTLLWRGEVNILKSSNELNVPLVSGTLNRTLGNVGDEISIADESTNEERSLIMSLRDTVAVIKRCLQSETKNANLFLTVYDPTNPVALSKCDEISSVLGRRFRVVEKKFRPADVGLGNFRIAPTIQLMAFGVPGASAVVEEALKTALYKPSTGSGTGKDRFKLERHGRYSPGDLSHDPPFRARPSNNPEDTQQPLI